MAVHEGVADTGQRASSGAGPGHTGRDADQSIDLALVDLNLRDGLTGPQIGERLANEYNAAVLFVTANPRLLGDGISGTIGVLTKPTDEDTLLAATHFALKRREGAPAEAPPSIRCFG